MGRLMGIEPTYAGATTRSVKPLRHKRHFVKLLIYFNIKYKYYCNLVPKKLKLLLYIYFNSPYKLNKKQDNCFWAAILFLNLFIYS